MAKKSRITAIMASVAAICMTVGLGACEGQVPTVSSKSTSEAAASPDLTEAQEKKIRTQILKTLDQANQDHNTDILPTIMSGPALQVRTSELITARATGTLDKKTTIPTDISQTIIPTDTGWPRTVFAITTTTEDQQSKRLLVLRQDSPRQNYKLWGVTRLFQGAQLPKFAIASIGSQMGDENDAGLVATPKEAVTQYVDVLQNGTNSQYASLIADDYFRQAMASQTQTVQEGMERNKGTLQQTFSAVDGSIVCMRAADGGELVVAQINNEMVRQAGEGRQSLPASDSETALFGGATATSTMKVTYVSMVALYIPPEGSDQQITAVGAEWQPVKVEAL